MLVLRERSEGNSQPPNTPVYYSPMRKRTRRIYSALREQLRREREARTAKLSPVERLRMALDLSDFCQKLAAKGREFRALQSPPNNRNSA
jgi:hypothetical protein